MEVRIKEIEERVIALLDENRDVLEERTQYGDAATSVVTLIRSLMPEAAEEVLLEIPIGRISETVSFDTVRLQNDGDGRRVAALPSDFLRLARFRMSDWTRGVRVPMDPEGDAYSLRCGSGLRSRRRQGPAVAVTHRDGIRVLEIFGTSAASRIVTAQYVAVPAVRGIYIDIPASCVDAVIRKTAGMVRTVIGEI